MSKYLVYDVIALEDLKFSKTNAQADSEETMEYIPGTAIRGAFIYKYIVDKGLKDINQGLHREKLLKGRIKFLNAYPKDGDDRSFPFPKVYFAPKEDLKSFDKKLDIKSGLDTILQSGNKRVKLSEFVGLVDGEYRKIAIKKGENLHINKMKGKANNKLFRYEFMKKDQIFQGIIKVEEDEDLDEVRELFEEKTLYLGGSKGSGYGKCSIGKMEVMEENPEEMIFQGKKEFTDEIYLIAMSDIIYRNELGEYKTFIPQGFIQNKLGLEDVKLIDSSIEVANITNFNNKWNCSTPNINSIKKGSVFKYKIKGELEDSIVNDLVNKGIGQRKLDGFGRFILMDKIEDSYIVDKRELLVELGEEENLSKLSSKEKSELQGIIDRIYKKRLEDDINKRVMKIDKEIKNRENMSNSQWGNLKELFISLSYEESHQAIKKYDSYMVSIKRKRSNSFRGLNGVKFMDMTLIDFLDEFVKNSLDIKEAEKDSTIEKIHLGELKSQVDREYLFSYNMRILSELSRYEIRKGER